MTDNDKIDIVVTWVDGSDEAWVDERNRSCPEQPIIASHYREWGIFKYWFRGIEAYAPWVNKIHFVTWGHLPAFLNVDHPKLNIVNHKDFIPEEYLPTFSSNTIELNLHRIPGIADKFVYFNDDTYVINPTTADDFFKNGKPRDIAVLNPIVPANFNTISGVMLNDIGLINQNFSIRKAIKAHKGKWFNPKYGKLNLLNLLFLPWKNAVGLYQQHLPSSMLKSTYEEVWNKEYNILNDTCHNKIRNVKTNVNQWVLKEWQVLKGEFEPRSVGFGKYIMIHNLKDVEKVKAILSQTKAKMCCLNDHVQEDLDLVIEQVTEIYEKKLPEKSSYEK